MGVLMNLIEYKGYYGSVEAHPDDDCLFGSVQFIRALISYEGQSLLELKAHFQSAMDDYFHYCEEHGIPPETPFKGSLNIRPGRELHREMALLSEELGISINEFVKQAIAEKVNQNSSHW